MDGKRFDAFSKQLATGVSRRTLVRGLLGATGATVLALRPFGQAFAEDETPTSLDPADPTIGAADPDSPSPTPADPPDASTVGNEQAGGNPASSADSDTPDESDTPPETDEADLDVAADPVDPCEDCGVCTVCYDNGDQRSCVECGDFSPPLHCCEDGVCAECCVDLDCPTEGDVCVSGLCKLSNSCDDCPEGMSCCEGGTTCEECCTDQDCGECEFCTVDGRCVPMDCAECESCVDGACTSICQDGEICCLGECSTAENCCGDDCGELLCCPDLGCAECCSTADCPAGQYCDDGGVCQPYSGDVCEPGYNFCGPNTSSCGDRCGCATTISGDAFCADGIGCIDCSSDADCEALPFFGPGSACVSLYANNGHCDCAGNKGCARACGSGPSNPCASCPAYCYPDNPLGPCCPPGQTLCCGHCVPWGPDISEENCSGDACNCSGYLESCEETLCCAGFVCNRNSICVTPCHPAGAACVSSEDCCPGLGLICDPVRKICATPCPGLLETCAVDTDCCIGLSCLGGYCGVPCVPTWHDCNHDGDCCDGLVCDPQRKVCKESATCHGLSEACNADADCCRQLSCIGGHCDTPRHCVERGDPCHPSLPCCDHLTCNGYVCDVRPTPPPHSGGSGGTASGKPAHTGGIQTTLPVTGSGGSTDSSDLMTLFVVGGAALAAGWLLHGEPEENTPVVD